MKNLEFKKDKYSISRRSYSRLLNIYCRKCNNLIAIYQKDGPGNLRRMYIDRILYPLDFVSLNNFKLDEISNLECNRCNEILGTPYIFVKEQRKAFRLYQDSIIKKVRKLKED
jgi:ribosomal protein S27E